MELCEWLRVCLSKRLATLVPMAKRTKPVAKKARQKRASKPAGKVAGVPVRAGAARVRTITIGTCGSPGERYEVRIGAGTIAHAVDGVLGTRHGALLVIDAGVPRALIEPLLRALDRSQVRWGVRVVEASEGGKSLLTLESILVEAARLRLERRDAIIGVGGGIVTDLAGFAAAVYRRGVRVIQCPTTLLAMVDAAVGGKTAANLVVPDAAGKPRVLKNLVGAFHQPARVQIDTDALASLPARELRAGLAECIKHGLLGGGLQDAGLLDWTEKNAGRILSLDGGVLAELIARNVALKARVVGRDEHENSTKPDGGRMMLNLGHTFAHAIETLGGMAWRDGTGRLVTGALKHGEAVGLGLLAAARVSVALGLCEKTLAGRVGGLLAAVGLPTVLESMPPGVQILERMREDKKTEGGRMRLVLPVRGGRVRVRDDVPEREVLLGIGGWGVRKGG